MTCKDCIHNEMCFGTHTDDSPTCCDFKDKSRYIELPCKVGDMVYRINGDNQLDELKVEYGYIDEDGAIRFGASCAYIMVCNGGFEDEDGIPCTMPNEVCRWMYNASEVGRSIFVTKKEAEKALKERERDNG